MWRTLHAAGIVDYIGSHAAEFPGIADSAGNFRTIVKEAAAVPQQPFWGKDG